MLRWLSIAIASAIVALYAMAGHAESERRVALIIGNSAYKKFPVLANPANDAREMAEVLAAADFQLYGGRPIIDGDRDIILKALRGFGNDLKNGAVGLFYYAGHGVQIEGINYLLPIDAKIEKRSDVRWELINVNDLLAEMQDAGNQLNIIILDACRNNPIGEPGMRGIAGTGLAQMVAPRGAFIAYATAPGKFAEDGRGEHSPTPQRCLKPSKFPD